MPVAGRPRGGQACGGLVAGHPPALRAATGLGEAARSAIERGVAADAAQAVLPAVSGRACPIGPVAASPAWTCPGMSWNADWGAVGAAVSRRRRKWPENVAPRRAWSVPSPLESCHGRLMSIGREHAAARSRERIGGMVGKRRSVIRVSPSPGREGPGRRRSVRHPPRALAREPPGQDGARRRPSRRAPPRGAPARWATAHCTDGAHGTVQAHSFQVCLAPAHRPALRFAPRRHRRDAALGGARADARNVSGAGMVRDRAAHAREAWICRAKGIFFRSRTSVMNSVRQRLVESRTMTGWAARETRSCGTARAGRRGPAGRCAARRTAVRGARRWRTWPVDRASRSASGGARRWLAGGRGGLGGARRVLGAAAGSTKHAETVSCDGIQAAWDGSGGGRLTRDNWCYRPSNGRFRALSH